jgi:putative FmdB family regulatory protein
MPIYRYQCLECDTTFKVLQRDGNETSAVCPECGGEKTKRLLPRVGVIYKGSGYYSTDYRGKRGKAEKEISGSKSEERKTLSDGKKTSDDGGTTPDGAAAASRNAKSGKATSSSTKE